MGSDDETDSDEVVWRRPSRSQQKRDADRIAALALRMVQLKPSELAQLRLEPELAEAVALGRELTKGARSRQLRRIAKLLREGDREAVSALLESGKNHVLDSALEEQEYEHWRTRILTEGDSALEEFLTTRLDGAAIEARRELRQLVRTAKNSAQDAKSKRARLLLLRKLRELGSRERSVGE